MEITYIFSPTERDKNFLRALKTKTYPQNEWSGRRTDDAFKNEWKDEISYFEKARLSEKKDSGHEGQYWSYGLNKMGLTLQDLVLKGEEVFEIKADL